MTSWLKSDTFRRWSINGAPLFYPVESKHNLSTNEFKVPYFGTTHQSWASGLVALLTIGVCGWCWTTHWCRAVTLGLGGTAAKGTIWEREQTGTFHADAGNIGYVSQEQKWSLPETDTLNCMCIAWASSKGVP